MSNNPWAGWTRFDGHDHPVEINDPKRFKEATAWCKQKYPNNDIEPVYSRVTFTGLGAADKAVFFFIDPLAAVEFKLLFG